MSAPSDLIEQAYPFQTLLGFEVSDWRADYALVTLPLRDHHANRFGIPHGGIYGCLLDTAMGYAGAWTGDPERRQQVMTLTLNVSFLAQPEGDALLAKGWRTGGGSRTFFTQGEVHDTTGRLIATGTGAFKTRK